MKSTALKENKDFRRLYYRGKSSASKNLVTYVMKCKRPGVRVGITTGKKIGKAAFSQLEGRICANCDIVFVARTSTCEVKMQQVLADMEKQLIQLGVIE